MQPGSKNKGLQGLYDSMSKQRSFRSRSRPYPQGDTAEDRKLEHGRPPQRQTKARRKAAQVILDPCCKFLEPSVDRVLGSTELHAKLPAR